MANVKEEAVMLLDPKAIKVGWRARKDYGDLSELADSIKSIGQLQPVVVRKIKGGYAIIAGLRRTRACRKLGIKVKAIVVKPAGERESLVMQLAENVKRKDFDRLEVGEGLKRLKALYEREHPDTKHGAKGRGRVPKSGTLSKERFTKSAARELSVSEQTVYDLLGIADLPKEELEEVESAKTARERNIAASKALSRVRKQRKEKKLEEDAADRQAARKQKKEKGKAGKTKTKAAPEPERARAYLTKKRWQDSLAKGEVPEIDLILTDPPYSLKRSTVTHTSRTSISEAVDWDKLDVGWVLACAERLAKTGSIIAFCPLEKIGDYVAAFAEAGLTYRGAIIWHKTNPAPSHRSAYVSSVEAMVWASRGKGKYTFRPFTNAGAREAHNMIEGPICGGKERLDHPAQKPTWLIERLVHQHTAKGDVIWDPFAGTGTTLVVAKAEGRTVYGNETASKYLRMAVLRLKAMR